MQMNTHLKTVKMTVRISLEVYACCIHIAYRHVTVIPCRWIRSQSVGTIFVTSSSPTRCLWILYSWTMHQSPRHGRRMLLVVEVVVVPTVEPVEAAVVLVVVGVAVVAVVAAASKLEGRPPQSSRIRTLCYLFHPCILM
jgi:hypothetical protein